MKYTRIHTATEYDHFVYLLFIVDPYLLIGVCDSVTSADHFVTIGHVVLTIDQ